MSGNIEEGSRGPARKQNGLMTGNPELEQFSVTFCNFALLRALKLHTVWGRIHW